MISYLAAANVPGDYALPQTKCYDVTNPTYMGMSGYSRCATMLYYAHAVTTKQVRYHSARRDLDSTIHDFGGSP